MSAVAFPGNYLELRRNSDNDEVDIGYHMALHIAAGLSCSNIMSYLVTYGGPVQPPYGGFSVTKRDKFGRTPLHYAAGRVLRCSAVADDGYDYIQLLLQAKADVNAVDNRGRTALHYIAIRGAGYGFVPDHFYPESPIQLLLRNGANPNISDVQGDTALHCASRCNWVDKHTLQILLTNHGDPNIPNKNRATCLHVLMMNEMPDNGALQILLHGGASPDAQDTDGKTPLHILVGKSRFFNNLGQTVKALLECWVGLNVNARDKEGMTPLHILARDTGPLCNRRQFPQESASVGHDILELLLRHGADVVARDLKGCTPCQLIVKNDKIAPRTSHLVVAALSQGSRKPITVSTSKKAPFRPWDSTPHPWEEGEQSESRYGTWSAPAMGLLSTAARM